MADFPGIYGKDEISWLKILRLDEQQEDNHETKGAE